MAATLEHRGPDSDGFHVDGEVGLGARRLSIIDLDGGDQPIANEDGTVHVVQNGEIYNYEELRARARARGPPVPHALGHRGARARLRGVGRRRSRERLRGMFAVAIWDARAAAAPPRARPFGIKPLYYRVDGDGLRFASELRALPRGEIDLDALEAFLAFNSIPTPLTIFRESRKLPAGARARLGRRRGRARAVRAPCAGRRRGSRRRRGRARRGVPRTAPRLGARAPRQRRAGRRAALGRRRLGGARGARGRGERRAGAHLLDRVRGELVRRARRRAAGRGAVRDRSTTSSCCVPTRRCSCPRSPRRSTSRSPTRRRCRRTSSRELAARHVKVALSGEGGDELFGGYYTYAADLLALRFGRARPLARRSSSGCRPRARRRASTIARSASCARRTCRRSSGTTAGRRSSRRTRAPS